MSIILALSWNSEFARLNSMGIAQVGIENRRSIYGAIITWQIRCHGKLRSVTCLVIDIIWYFSHRMDEQSVFCPRGIRIEVKSLTRDAKGVFIQGKVTKGRAWSYCVGRAFPLFIFHIQYSAITLCNHTPPNEFFLHSCRFPLKNFDI